jgi:hypothetical protein
MSRRGSGHVLIMASRCSEYLLQWATTESRSWAWMPLHAEQCWWRSSQYGGADLVLISPLVHLKAWFWNGLEVFHQWKEEASWIWLWTWEGMRWE